jgi:hypothetical protein
MALEAFRATLAGLAGINVQVEPLNADAERDGLLRSDLQADTEAQLRAAGLRVLSHSEVFYEEPATPFLHLDVMAALLDDRYVYSIRAELWQSVRLARDPRIRTLGVTWTPRQVVGIVTATRLAEVRAAVRSVVAEFIEDYRMANPPPAEPEPEAVAAED